MDDISRLASKPRKSGQALIDATAQENEAATSRKEELQMLTNSTAHRHRNQLTTALNNTYRSSKDNGIRRRLITQLETLQRKWGLCHAHDCPQLTWNRNEQLLPVIRLVFLGMVLCWIAQWMGWPS